jgi:ketosteroid isomerase-like protein
MTGVESDPRAVVARYWDALWLRCELSAVDELFTEPYVRHSAAGTRTLTRAQLKDELRAAWRLLHDPQTTVDDQVADGDRVWSRATTRGVTLDTGDPSVLTWLIVHRVADGRLAESWSATLPGIDWRT